MHPKSQTNFWGAFPFASLFDLNAYKIIYPKYLHAAMAAEAPSATAVVS